MPDWDGIIAHVCHLTGWTWDYTESTLTVPRLKALYDEWQRHPPIALMLAAYLGIGPKEFGSTEELLGRIQTLQGRQ